ncbi:hypothetical protein TNCV_1938201 [Trichonephila clavipes]|nr:hypothetical protein TNCV_1938201 [Trichonephila clavipes]
MVQNCLVRRQKPSRIAEQCDVNIHSPSLHRFQYNNIMQDQLLESCCNALIYGPVVIKRMDTPVNTECASSVRFSFQKLKMSDFLDFQRGQIVGARLAGASASETSQLLGFFKGTVSKKTAYTHRGKTRLAKQNSGRKDMLRERDRWVIEADCSV